MASEYKLSFTSGSLMMRGSVALAELYLEQQDWVKVRQSAYAAGVLQANRKSSSIRVLREIAFRLATLEEEELRLLVEGDLPEQRLLAFLAMCRYYQFLREFVLEVVRQNWLQFKTVIDEVDYSRFYDEKELLHDELAGLAESSRAKVREVVFRTLAEVGLISSSRDKTITPPLVPPHIIHMLCRRHPEDLALLLLSDREIEKYQEKRCR